MNRTEQPSQQGELVFCHECENEWSRRQHGLTCPECHSDFTEIIEPDYDPRSELQSHDPDYNELHAPDPDEDDIDGLHWEQTAPGHFHVRGNVNRTFTPGAQTERGGQQGGLGSGLMGLIGSVLQNMAHQPASPPPRQPQPQVGSEQNRPASAPGSPRSQRPTSPYGQQETRNNGTFIRHGHGPGFTWTVASSSNMNVMGGPQGLFPRNSNGPQPFQVQPQQLDAMMQMIMNIGAMRYGGPGSPGPGNPHDDPFGHVFMGGAGMGRGGQGMGPFANLMNLFGPPGGQMGDAVYSQEALDRIITQLMEQHQSGNAPGPASEEAIQSLPTRSISEKDLGENGKADCSICMDEVPIGAAVTVLPCNHWFHADCVKAWLCEHDTCPHCRQGIMPKESEGGAENRARQSSQAPRHDMTSPEYTRPAYFPRQSSSSGAPRGSEQNPYTISDSPTLRRQTNAGDRRRSSTGGSGGIFNRMREAFGRSSSSNNPQDGDSASGNGSRM